MARIDEIVAAAKRQLATVGPTNLSVRAVARDLDLVSSAVYRYVATRDELLTLLIVDAYDSLGDATERALVASRRRAPAARWVDAAVTIRHWALEHRHEYALLYGTPVPGYEAPPERATPAGTRVSRALLSIVVDAAHADRLRPSAGPPLPRHLAADLRALSALVGIDLDETVLVRALAAWSQLFGLITFELFSQTRGMTEHHEELLRATAALMAEQIGLT